MKNTNILESYFQHIAKELGKELILPYPNAKPKFGNHGEGLENKKAARKFAAEVLEEYKNGLF